MLLHQQARPCAAHTGRWLFLLMAAVVLAGCAGPAYPPAPLKAAGGDYQYIIGPLDTLAISVWRNPELATTVTVRPDGRISAPLVGDVTAQGLKPDQLSKALEKALAKYLIDPSVTISVGGFQGRAT
jgi:polysaccharide biosynthesis/export protein